MFSDTNFHLTNLPNFIRILAFGLSFILGSLFVAAQPKKTNSEKAKPENILLGTIGPHRAWVKLKAIDAYFNPDYEGSKDWNNEATLSFSISPEVRPKILQLDLTKEWLVQSISLLPEGRNLKFERDRDFIWVEFPSTIKLKDSFLLKVNYTGKPRVAKNPPWDAGISQKKDSEGKLWWAYTSQGKGAYTFIPCIEHPTVEPERVRVTFTHPDTLAYIGNGIKTGSIALDARKRSSTFQTSYPINLYSISFQIGNYAVWDTSISINGKLLPFRLSFLKPNIIEAKKKLFPEAVQMLEAYNEMFGEYPFKRDGFGLVEVPYWGMEHQSAVAYGNKFKQNDYGFDFILVHEAGHEYWGNSISCDDVADLWIHEGFCTYTETLLLEKRKGKELALRYLQGQRKSINNDRPLLGKRGINDQSVYNTDIYYKGAWVLHTLRSLTDNDSSFFAALRLMNERYKYRTINSDTIAQFFNSSLKPNLGQVMLSMLNQKAYLSIKLKKENGDYYFKLGDEWGKQALDLTLTLGKFSEPINSKNWTKFLPKKNIDFKDLRQEINLKYLFSIVEE